MLPTPSIRSRWSFRFLLALGAPGLFQATAHAAPTWNTTAPMATPRRDHTAALLGNGKVLVAGGEDAAGASLTSAELYDPATGTWASAAAMAAARKNHTATVLPSGKVLVAGGSQGFSYLASAELYDPATGTWSATGGFALRSRAHHVAVRLRSGKVLVAGGNGSGFADDQAELYDPASGAWSPAGTLVEKRSQASAVLLPSGKVLVVGGFNLRTNTSTAAAEIYDPVDGTWTATGPLAGSRHAATATLLPDGRVLVAGGSRATVVGGGLNVLGLSSAEIYDPALGTWSATASLAQATMIRAAATLLPSGRVLVSEAGYSQSYDPAAGTWSAVGLTPLARSQHSATLLPSGKVLVAGGLAYVAPSWVVVASAEEVDPAAPAWSVTGPELASYPGPTATLLPSEATDLVLVAGGWTGAAATSDAALYSSAKGGFKATAMPTARTSHTATLLPSGEVLVVGGTSDGAKPLGSAEVYGWTGDKWRRVDALGTPRWAHTATLLPSGKVLVAGGQGGAGPVDGVEIYDPALGAWTRGAALLEPRSSHTALLLPSGLVLVAGGLGAAGPLASAEVYDPGKDTWTPTGALAEVRSAHTMTLLASGRVLVAGGTGAKGTPLGIAELYDAKAETWAVTGSLAAARSSHTATLLPSGRVLVAGGSGPAPLASAEWYDPATGVWVSAGTMATVRTSHGAVLLPGGAVLVVGGADGAAVPAELFDEGRGAQVAWTPVLDGALPPSAAGAALPLTGALFTGISEGSSGTAQTSPSDRPLVWVQQLGTEHVSWARVTDFGPSGATVTVPALRQGQHLVRVVVNGVASAARLLRIRLPAAVAPASPSTPPRGAIAFSVAGGSPPPTWTLAVNASGGSVDPATGVYTAGPTGGVTDTVRATDWIGDAVETTVTVTPGVSSEPSAPVVPPRGSVTFAAAGGSGRGWVWSLATSASGGSIDAATGVYTAGSTGGVTDTVHVADDLGNVQDVAVTVTAGVSIVPSTASLQAGSSRVFTASGGSGTGFVWSLWTNASGGSIDPASGRYTAGSTGGTTDTVQVTDDLGNLATVAVTVTAAPAPPPPPPPPSEPAASGGGGCGYGTVGADLSLLPLGLLLLRRRRGGR